MAKNREFYRGQKKRRNYALIPFVIGLALITLIVVAFYGLQKYAVITKDGVRIVMPWDEPEAEVDEEGHEIREFEEVETQLVFDEPDYSRITARAGRRARPMRAIYIAAEDVNRDNLLRRAEQLNSGNALVLEMKPRSGYLLWVSDTELAQQYSLSVVNELTSDMPGMLQELRDYAAEQDKDIWLVAQISCCVDGLLATRTTDFALRTASGADYVDETGYWLDPYNAELRRYIVALVQELYAMGFDEVILADVMHPVPETREGETPAFIYTREMSAAPAPSTPSAASPSTPRPSWRGGRTASSSPSIWTRPAPWCAMTRAPARTVCSSSSSTTGSITGRIATPTPITTATSNPTSPSAAPRIASSPWSSTICRTIPPGSISRICPRGRNK